MLWDISMLAWSPWGEKAEHTPHRWASRFETPNCFPLKMHLRQHSCLPASLWCACLLLGSALGSTVCLHSKQWAPCVSSLRLVGISPDVLPCSHFPPGQRECSFQESCKCWVCSWLATIFFLHTHQILCLQAKDFLKVLGGDRVMFLYSEIKDNPVLYNSP